MYERIVLTALYITLAYLADITLHIRILRHNYIINSNTAIVATSVAAATATAAAAAKKALNVMHTHCSYTRQLPLLTKWKLHIFNRVHIQTCRSRS